MQPNDDRLAIDNMVNRADSGCAAPGWARMSVRGSVIGIVAFLLLAKLSMYAAELNPVLARRLYPRALPLGGEPTDADRQVRARGLPLPLAATARRRRCPAAAQDQAYQDQRSMGRGPVLCGRAAASQIFILQNSHTVQVS